MKRALPLQKRLTYLVAVTSLVLALSLGLSLGLYATQMQREGSSLAIEEQALTVALQLQSGPFEELLQSANEASSSYDSILHVLQMAKQASQHDATLYTLAQTDSGWIFVVDGYEGEDHSELASLYEVDDPTTEALMWQALEQGHVRDTRLVEDEWGVWMSAYARIPNTPVPMLVGIDIPASFIQSNEQRVLMIAMIVAFVGALLAAFVVGRYIKNALAIELGKAQRAVQNVSKGDLRDPEPVTTQDELGKMSTALTETVRHLRSVMGSEQVNWDEVKHRLAESHHLAGLVENMPVPFLELDTQNQIKKGNKAFSQQLNDVHFWSDKLRSLQMGDPAPIHFFENRHWKLELHSVHNTQGEEQARLCILSDMTDHVLHEEARQRTLEEEAKRIHHAKEIAEKERIRLEEEHKQSHYLRQQVDHVLTVMQSSHQGDLRQRTRLEGSGAIEKLATGLDGFLENLCTSLRELTHHFQELSYKAETLLDMSHTLYQDADLTATHIESCDQVADALRHQLSQMSEVATTVSRDIVLVAAHSKQVSEAAGSAVNIAKQAYEHVQELSHSTHEIQEVSRLVADIARQTNLLALNAAVEAARAGDSGRGFAVVAGEVKVLADRTHQATEDIDQRLENVAHTTQTVMNIVKNIQSVVQTIESKQNEVDQTLTRQSQATQAIAEKVNHTAQGVHSVSQHLQTVAQAASTSVQGASQSREESQALAQMAEQMQELLNRFRV